MRLLTCFRRGTAAPNSLRRHRRRSFAARALCGDSLGLAKAAAIAAAIADVTTSARANCQTIRMTGEEPFAIDTTPDTVDRVYSVTAVVQWPMRRISATKVGDQDTFETRIHPQVSTILGYTFSLGAYPFPDIAPPPREATFTTEPAALKTRVTATSLIEAAEGVRKPLFLLVDDLAFQLQSALSVQRLDMVNVTPEVVVGDLREACTFHGFDPYRTVRSTSLDEFDVAMFPALRSLRRPFDSRIRDALDWYMKGLGAINDPDRFIFFWVAFELLVKLSSIEVTEPTKLRCQHSIPNCPECGKATATYRQGATQTAVLQDLGATEDQAKHLWKMRQMVHGARSFGPNQTGELYEGVHLLRRCVFAALKKILGWDPEARPRARETGLSIHGSLMTSTPVRVREWDLAEEQY